MSMFLRTLSSFIHSRLQARRAPGGITAESVGDLSPESPGGLIPESVGGFAGILRLGHLRVLRQILRQENEARIHRKSKL